MVDQKQSARLTAMRDITEDIRIEKLKGIGLDPVASRHLVSKEIRQMNRELGLHKINKANNGDNLRRKK